MSMLQTPRVDTKRALDVVVSTALLAFMSPILGALSVAVRLDSPGPVLFRQERVGLDGRLFRIHKFRSMRIDHDGRLVSTSGDSRVTRTGRFLRKTKLDELPQLIDVLRGDMSLVGPRPEVPFYVSYWPAEQRDIILSVRPGITDPASVALRNEAVELAMATDPERHYLEELLPRKTAMYVDYVENRSFVLDLQILGKTVLAVLRG